MSNFTDAVAESLYDLLERRPRPSWSRASARTRERYEAAAYAIQSADEPFSVSLSDRLDRCAAKFRAQHLQDIRAGRLR